MVDLAQLAEAGSPEEVLVRRLDLDALPRHVAIIMDGNGRWAQQRGRPRVEGHRAGAAAVRDVVEASRQLGLEVLTLYAFSTENWKRPRFEIWTLMNLLKEYLRRELENLRSNGIRLQVLGRWRELDEWVVREIEHAVEATAACDQMVLNVALNYSGRCEIVDACRRIVTDWASGKDADIDEETIGRYLYSAGCPDPDLLIRTSGEMRLSNFLLWQIAYTELWVTDALWPDFRRRELFEAICEYQHRERRFGAVRPDAESLDAEPLDSESQGRTGR
jgi:undecaprenyl diphosphate synthase